MAKKGLREWVKQDWVDIANKDGWLIPEMWEDRKWKKKKKLSKMRAHCKSNTNDKGQRASAVEEKS